MNPSIIPFNCQYSFFLKSFRLLWQCIKEARRKNLQEIFTHLPMLWKVRDIRSTVSNIQKGNNNNNKMCLIWKCTQPTLGSSGGWWSNVVGIFRVPCFFLFSLQMLIYFSYFGVISYLHHRVEEEIFVKIKFVNFTFLRKVQIVNFQRKVVLFPYYFKDYIVCVKYFNHFPLIIMNYLLTLFWSASSVIFLSWSFCFSPYNIQTQDFTMPI